MPSDESTNSVLGDGSFSVLMFHKTNIVADTSFIIASANTADTNQVDWIIAKP